MHAGPWLERVAGACGWSVRLVNWCLEAFLHENASQNPSASVVELLNLATNTPHRQQQSLNHHLSRSKNAPVFDYA
jgi:hypothetical protein